MKKIISMFLLGMLFLSGSYAGSCTKKDTTETQKTMMSANSDMVIIAPEIFSESLQPLITHKNNHGVKTFLKTTEDIYREYTGRDDAEKIKFFIKDAIESNNIKYVLLLGGRQGQGFKWFVPCRYSNVDDGFVDKQFISDLYFADIYKENGEFEDWDSNGNGIFAEWYSDHPLASDIMDLKPDVAVGRLPCRNENEVTSIVEKIIEYENNTYGKTWFHRALLVGGDTNPGAGDPFPFEGEADCNYIEQYFDSFNITKLFTSDDTLESHENFISSFNKGNGFVVYYGHGQQDGLYLYTPTGEKITVFDNKYVSQLKNKGMYPIMIAGCCLTTEFDVGILNFLTIVKNLKKYYNVITCKYECVPEVISWNMVKKSDGGSIAHIGSSSTAWGAVGDNNHDGIPDTVQNGFTTGLCAEFFRIIKEEGIDILGKVYIDTLTRNIVSYHANADRIQCKCVQEFQLIGDPSLKIGGYPSS
jgi:hypothetical protein